jgi:hypothetical protein
MSSNRNVSSTASILTLTLGLLNPAVAQQMVELLEKQEQHQKNQAKVTKQLTEAVYKQNQFAQEQALVRTPSHVENHQSQHYQPQANQGRGRSR